MRNRLLLFCLFFNLKGDNIVDISENSHPRSAWFNFGWKFNHIASSLRIDGIKFTSSEKTSFLGRQVINKRAVIQ